MQSKFFCCDRDFAATVICHWPPRSPERQLIDQTHYSFMEVAVCAQSVWLRGSCCSGPDPYRQREAHTCRAAESLTHPSCFFLLKEQQHSVSISLCFLHLGCWKSHPGDLKEFTGIAGWESQSFWTLMPIILTYEALIPRIWPIYCKSSSSI